MRPEVRRLLRQADRDLENAQRIIAIHAYEVAAFLVQQGVEKYLKAAWVVIKKEPAAYALADGTRRTTRRPSSGVISRT